MAALYIFMDIVIIVGVVIGGVILIIYIGGIMNKGNKKKKYGVSEYKNNDIYELNEDGVEPFSVGDYHAATNEYSTDTTGGIENELDKL